MNQVNVGWFSVDISILSVGAERLWSGAHNVYLKLVGSQSHDIGPSSLHKLQSDSLPATLCQRSRKDSRKMAYHISRIHAPDVFYIPNGFKEGRHIIIRGRVNFEGERFHVNIQEGPDQGCDIAFHFNPRPAEAVCVRNSFQGGWMEEERDQPHFPFEAGRYFLLRIEVDSEAFRVHVNGKPFLDFNHRLDMSNMHFIQLSDGAEYYEMTFQERYGTPYLSELRNGMSLGKAVRFRGACTDSDGFSINFACDCDNDACAFHFNPRPNQGSVVRNAKFGDWGDEETDLPDDSFPFSPGEYFDTLIVATEAGYAVYVNDKLFTVFSYRNSLEDVQHMLVKGDVSMRDIQFYEPMDDDFVKRIPSGLEKGDIIYATGFMKPGGNSFSLNLKNGDSPDDDTALHFNPRVDEGEVVMNSSFGGWGEEERKPLCQPLLDMLPFEIKIVVKRRKFKIYVNGKKFAKYRARGNLEDIKGINIKGDAYIFETRIQHKLDKPHVEKIPGNLREYGWVVVSATPKKNSEHFSVNLQCGSDDDADIAFHLNPRLQEECTVRNSRVDGNWQDEERDQPCFPFHDKDTIEMSIQALPDKFKTYLNGKHYIDFDHRLPLDSICHLKLDGDADYFEPEYY